jgi:hypothetical protein
LNLFQFADDPLDSNVFEARFVEFKRDRPQLRKVGAIERIRPNRVRRDVRMEIRVTTATKSPLPM